MKQRIGTLTGGGDTAALNAALKGVAEACETCGYELVGFREGWWGALNKVWSPLPSNLIDKGAGGTILKSSRTNLLGIEGGIDQVIANLRQMNVMGLVPIGGNDTLTVGSALSDADIMTNCVTKTIDNDVGTNAPAGDLPDLTQMVNYFCPGYPTAARRVADYTRDMRTTAYSHNRIVVIEVMGRDYSWLALASSYGLPDFIITAELGLNYEALLNKVRQRYLNQGNVIIVVPEGLKDEFGQEITLAGFYEADSFGQQKLGGVSEVIAARLKHDLAPELKKYRSSYCHAERLSYWQRAGTATALDQNIAYLLGYRATAAFHKGKCRQVACVRARKEGHLITESLSLEEALPRDNQGRVITRPLDSRFYNAEEYTASRFGLLYLKPILRELAAPYTAGLEVRIG